MQTLRAAAISAAFVAMAAAAPAADIIEQILVKVNGEIITKTDLEQRQIAVIRQRGNPRLAENYTQKFLTSADGDPWKSVAAGEAWITMQRDMAPRAASACPRRAGPGAGSAPRAD